MGIRAATIVLVTFASACKFGGDTPESGDATLLASGDGSPQIPVPVVLAADPRTGAIDVTLKFAGAGAPPGEPFDLAVGATLVHATDSEIDCASLTKVLEVIAPHPAAVQDVDVRARIEPALLASPVLADPEDDAKADLQHLFAGHLRRVDVCVIDRRGVVRGKGAALAEHGAKTDLLGKNAANDLTRYAALCAERLGPLPEVNCLDPKVFKPLAVTKEGHALKDTESAAQCDYPSFMRTGDDRFCKPGARLGKLEIKDEQGAVRSEASVLCRRYYVKGEQAPHDGNDPTYNDIAIIQHNAKTGATCFFQALGRLDGRTVPSPSAANSANFWLAPRDTAAINCVGCHDADPFVHTPYVRQTADPKDPAAEPWLPSKPFAKYVILGGSFGFDAWPTSYAIKPLGAEDCTACHRLGSMQGCETLDGDAIGAVPFAQGAKSLIARSFPASHWMPPSHEAYGITSASSWHDQFKVAADAIRKCCMLKDDAGKRILGVVGSFRSKARYGQKLSAEDRDLLQAEGCLATPVSMVEP